MTTLRAHRPLGILAPDEALATFARTAGAGAIGFCYSPAEARWFRLAVTGEARDDLGQLVDLGTVFEVRAFTADHELRWHRFSPESGSAVLVHEEPAAGAQAGADPDGAPQRFDDAPYRRLLWGTAHAPSADGWLSLSAARIGTLRVPVNSSSTKARVWLEAVEYVARDTHGNASIVDERLVALVAEPDEEESS